ncbi:hypothetical protein PInf_017210 [Phytophthora infestans]|nr:hypothetical protein PInf_017210 [Phytophthora infestans]
MFNNKYPDNPISLLSVFTSRYGDDGGESASVYGKEAFTSRKLEVLDDYIAKFNNEKGGQESLLKTLTRGFGGEEKLLSILATAERNPYTHLRATELGNLRKWQHDKVEPSKVMKLLKLDGEVENA